MSEPNVVLTLRRKRDDIEAEIGAYERKIEGLRHDLAHVNATLRLFELNGEPEVSPRYVNLQRIFRRFEISRLCHAALASAPDGLDTRELAVAAIRAKGLDESDAVLRKSVAYRVVQALRMQEKRGRIVGAGKRKGVRVWRLAKPSGGHNCLL